MEKLSWDGLISGAIAIAIWYVGWQQQKRAEKELRYKAYGVIYAAWFELRRMFTTLDEDEDKFEPTALNSLREYYSVLNDHKLIEKVERAYSAYQGLRRKYPEMILSVADQVKDAINEGIEIDGVKGKIDEAANDLGVPLDSLERQIGIDKRTLRQKLADWTSLRYGSSAGVN